MELTWKGNTVHLLGKSVQVNDVLQEFTMISNDLKEIHKSATSGKRLFLCVPSLDTKVCSLEVETFMNYIQDVSDVTCYVVSMDLPFALERWCQSRANSNIMTASDYKYHSFTKATGTYVEEMGLLARAVFVVDQQDVVRYVEYVKEISEEPNYDAALNALAKL